MVDMQDRPGDRGGPDEGACFAFVYFSKRVGVGSREPIIPRVLT